MVGDLEPRDRLLDPDAHLDQPGRVADGVGEEVRERLLDARAVPGARRCRRFTGEVLPSPEMRELGQRVVKVKVDAEGGEQDRALAQRLSVRSFPTQLVIASPGRPPARVDQWSSPRAFAESCQRLLPNSARDHLDRGIALSQGGSPEAAAAELKAAASNPALALGALDRLGLLALRTSCFSRA